MTGIVPRTDFARPAGIDNALTTLYGVAVEHPDPAICSDLVSVARYVVQLEKRISEPAPASVWRRLTNDLPFWIVVWAAVISAALWIGWPR